MYKFFTKLLVALFRLLSLIRCLRLILIQYVAFRPPEVGYLIRNRNEVIRTNNLTLSLEERAKTFDEVSSPLSPLI